MAWELGGGSARKTMLSFAGFATIVSDLRLALMDIDQCLNLYAGENGIAGNLIPRRNFLIVVLKNMDFKVRF